MTSTIPVNDLARYAAEIQSVASARAAEVIASGYYVLGPWVSRFEEAFAKYCGVAHCIGVGNGTDALELSLRALDIGPGDAVVVAANAAMYGTGAVLAVGAEPHFADVDPDTGLVTEDTLRSAFEASTATPVSAVIVTHLYGRLCDMDGIVALCREYGVRLIEDCAQAHGARNAAGVLAGAFGDMATFSFYPTKNLGAVGDGGALVCNSPELAEKLRRLRQYGWSKKYCNALRHGRNTRLDELQASLLHLFLPDLDRRNMQRKDVALRYSTQIHNPAIRLPDASGPGYVAHLYVVQCRDRDGLAVHLKSFGIATDVHYPTPDYRQPVHGERFANVSLPTTEALCGTALTLPCFPELSDDEVTRVIDACNAWSPR